MRGTGEPEGRNWNLEPNTVAGGLSFNTIGAGLSHSCGLTEEGAVYCWGAGEQLGAPSATLDPSEDNCGLGPGIGAPCAHAPVLTELAAAARTLFVGATMTCALTLDDQLWCWGRLPGELEPVLAPRQVPAPTGVSTVAVGETHLCILTTAGEASCLGSNSEGTLGTGETGEFEPEFQPVAGDIRFAALSAGLGNTCGLTTGGAVYCWGNNAQGQLGVGDFENRSAPEQVRLTD